MSTNLIARVLPYLPGSLIGGNGIDVIQAGTAFTIQWNPTEAGFSAFGLGLGAAVDAPAAQASLVPAWTVYTPSPSSGSATFTVNTARYSRTGKTVHVMLDVTV